MARYPHQIANPRAYERKCRTSMVGDPSLLPTKEEAAAASAATAKRMADIAAALRAGAIPLYGTKNRS